MRLCAPLTSEIAISIGLQSGEYGGNSRTRAPALSICSFTRSVLCAGRLSITTTCLGHRFGTHRVVRPRVHVEHVHRSYERRAALGCDDPLLLEPGLEVVFLSVRQTMAGSIESTTFISTNRSASSDIVHFARPSGASCSPSILRY